MLICNTSLAHLNASQRRGAACPPAQHCVNILAHWEFLSTFMDNTRAVPLVRKENAHKGRVFFCPNSKHQWKGAAL